VEGVINNVKMELGTLPQESQDLIIKRRLICATCPFSSSNAAVNNGYKTERLDEHCVMCSCNIHAKTACLDCKCGISVYNETVGDNDKLELKW